MLSKTPKKAINQFPFGSNRLAQSVLLFTNLFVIIAALYHLRPASGSIFMNALSAEHLP
jgi:AAA family ATP:ADP antiporter